MEAFCVKEEIRITQVCYRMWVSSLFVNNDE